MNMRFFERFLPVFEADGAGGGGSSAAPAAPSGGGAPPPAGGAGGPSGGATTAAIGADGAQAGSGGWKAPDFLPEHLRGKDVNETFSKVADDWKAFRDRMAQMPQPGKAASDYAYTPSDKAAPFLGDLSNDPVMNVGREAALKAGLSPKQYADFVGTFYDTLAEGGKLPQPYDAGRERDLLIGPEARIMTDAQKVAAIEPILKAGAGFLDGLMRTGEISKESYSQLGALLDTAQGAKTVAALAKAFSAGNRGLNLGGEGGGQRQISAADLRARQRDARNDPDSGSFDRAYREETLRLYQQHYG